MNIIPVAGSMATVMGNRMIIVLAALKPGTAPTITPSNVNYQMAQGVAMTQGNGDGRST